MAGDIGIDEAIASLTGVSGGGRRLKFACDIGDVDADAVEWIFEGRRKVQMPRSTFEYEREPRVNFWLVTMPERIAAIFGLSEIALSEDAAEEHRKRIHGEG